MKKTSIAIALSLLLLAIWVLRKKNNSIEELRAKHKAYLETSPVKESLKLTKAQRKSKGLPPNKYFEREWELTMNPATGKPEPGKVLQLQEKLSKKNTSRKSPGDAITNPWIERGPNNVGGRTRTLLFDPNDTTNKRVFAGGVSGGLWVNNDITNASSSWIQITSVPGNMNVSSITVDPRNSNIWYLGTGEQYTAGAVVGNGVYKSTDGGTSWTNISLSAMGVGGLTGSSEFLAGVYYINDIIAWDNGTSTEVFVAVGGHVYRDAGNPNNWLGLQSAGLYRFANNNWSRIESSNFRYQFSGFDFYFMPNDFEIGPDNTLWMGTIGSAVQDKGAGLVFKTTNGTSWNLAATLNNADRVELAVSSSDADKIYALVEGTDGEPHIFKTSNSFTSVTELPKPNDVDEGIDADDFTRGQSYYNLVIEVSPSNDEIIYVGGIDLFRSSNGGTSWSQISKWSNNNELRNLNVSKVHADQHAMVFRPGDSNQAVFGNDGGVFFGSSLSTAFNSTTALSKRNTNYNVTQFYRGAIAPNVDNEFFLGGTQDNGSPFFENPTSTINSSVDISGGDGAYCFVDQSDSSYMIVSYVYNNSYYLYNFNLSQWREINDDEEGDGDFINQADLDSNLDIMYANGSNDSGIQIYRYSDLTSIAANGSASKTTLSNVLFNSSPTALRVSPYTTSSSTLLVGTEEGKLLKVTNANTMGVWSNITNGQFLGSISDIEFGRNESEILVTFHNYGVSNVWFSDDGGISWEDKEGNLPDLPVKAILQNPLDRNEVIIGTDLGVWKTANFNESSPNWVQTYNGMSNVKVTDLQLRAEDNTVLATTFGRGVFTGQFKPNGPRLEISANETEKTIAKGSSQVVYEVDYEVFESFNESVSFSLSGVPSAVVTTISPTSPFTVNTNGNFTITLSNITSTNAVGIYDLELSANSATANEKLTLKLITDTDNDGVSDLIDNCVYFANSDQTDTDNDGEGDTCDDDDDGDGVKDVSDNSQFVPNPDQTDTDNDGEGDASDPDDDNDGDLDDVDNCPLTANPEQRDFDEDGEGDICDDNITISVDVSKGFSPNGDGVNDFWVIEKIAEIYPENTLQIFNKSGQLVYEKSPYDNSFDGIANVGSSGKLPIGAYVYQIITGDPVADFYPVGYVKKGWIYIKY
jgi:gliding motility-associated-like protein